MRQGVPDFDQIMEDSRRRNRGQAVLFLCFSFLLFHVIVATVYVVVHATWSRAFRSDPPHPLAIGYGVSTMLTLWGIWRSSPSARVSVGNQPLRWLCHFPRSDWSPAKRYYEPWVFEYVAIHTIFCVAQTLRQALRYGRATAELEPEEEEQARRLVEWLRKQDTSPRFHPVDPSEYPMSLVSKLAAANILWLKEEGGVPHVGMNRRYDATS